MSRALGWTGRRTIYSALYLVDLTVFIQQAIRDAFQRGFRLDRSTYHTLIAQLIFSGVDALPLVTLLALATGIIFTSELIHLTSTFTTEADIMGTLVYLVTFEIGPLLTAFILIGRSGSAMAVDLGYMQLNREIEALALLGINANKLLVSSRLIAAAIAQLVLATYFSGIALYGGVTLAGILHSPTYIFYLKKVLVAQSPLILLLFIIKNIIYGLIIAGSACFHALRVSSSSTQLPQQTQRAIVNGLVIIMLFDTLLVFATLGT